MRKSTTDAFNLGHRPTLTKKSDENRDQNPASNGQFSLGREASQRTAEDVSGPGGNQRRVKGPDGCRISHARQARRKKLELGSPCQFG